MAPIIASLLKSGLGILANAVMVKGKEVVEDKLGIKLPETITPEQVVILKQAEYQHEQWLIDATLRATQLDYDFLKAEDANITDRWKSDMGSDSWLSKNIRPSVLLYILTAYTILALMSAFDLNVSEAYVTLLGQWGMLVMTAYFGGRSIEKVIQIRNKGK
jgi:hypothetical protein